MAGIGSPFYPYSYQLWELQQIAVESDKLKWERLAYQLAQQAAFHGAKRAKPKHFNPYKQKQRSMDLAAWEEFAKKAKERLPDNLSEEEIERRWQDYLED